MGIYVDLGRAKKVRSVLVDEPEAGGWTGEVYVADRRSPPRRLGGRGDPAATGSVISTSSGAEGRYVLVWFTSLPPSDGGFRLAVAEIKVDT